MKYDNFHYELCPPEITDVKDFFRCRKALMMCTSVKWITWKRELDPGQLGGIYNYQFPILIFLN